jgi:RNA polymerase sigma-70 factor (ECF subfamily)
MAGSRTDPIEDARLVAELVAGSDDALAMLYDRHAGAVHGAAFRLTSDRALAEDIVQETFLALWNRAEQFDPSRGSLAAWLLTIARNRTIDRLRATGRRPTVVSISAAGMPDETEAATFERIARLGIVVGDARAGTGPEAELARAELRDVLQGALATIAEPEREVLLLAYRDELSQSEIAVRLGWPLGTVKTRTRRALLKLRLELGPELGPVPMDGAALESPARAARVGAGARADR